MAFEMGREKPCAIFNTHSWGEYFGVFTVFALKRHMSRSLK